MHIKQFLLILLLFLFCVNSYALDLTKVTNKNNKINIELNNILYLQDFVLVDDKLVSPFYENNGTKYYVLHTSDKILYFNDRGEAITQNPSE